MTADWAKYILDFKFLARTSRDAMRQKRTYFLRIPSASGDGTFGVGECALFAGLSADDKSDYETRLDECCSDAACLSDYSSIRFGQEVALQNAGYADVPDTPFTRGEEGIRINGLIWMGDKEEMRRRIDEKLASGFNVLKLKIGGIDFQSELELLKYIRSRYSENELELRLDANGSFTPGNAPERLKRLSDFRVHSIEQPIKAGQAAEMAELCRTSPIDIALDEELIGMPDGDKVKLILDVIRPKYLILKPALCGGLSGATLWADEAERRSTGWWVTSALESNIGLLAIARWASARGVRMPQGLGTGMLYDNNIPSGLELRGSQLFYNPDVPTIIPDLQWRH